MVIGNFGEKLFIKNIIRRWELNITAEVILRNLKSERLTVTERRIK
jgi:hypothetical protein